MRGLLLIDVGNTRVKWCIRKQDSNNNSFNIFAESHLCKDTRFIADRILSEVNDVKIQINKIVVSSVRPNISESLLALLSHTLRAKAYICSTSKKFGELQNSYTDVSMMGVDRWLGMIAASECGHEACLVISLGTAITVDYVNESGNHLGGYITTGLQTRLSSLFKSTEKVLFENSATYSSLLGNSTQSCVINGVFCEISDFIIARMEKACELDIYKVVLTGGDSTIWLESIRRNENTQKMTIYHKPELIFEGLLTVAQHELKKM